jgi:hypothetical protein
LKISGLPNFARASSRAARQNETSIVLDSRHASTARDAQSMIADVERDINGLPAEERLAARRLRSAPLVAALEEWMRAERAKLSRHRALSSIAALSLGGLRRRDTRKPRPIRM